MKELVPDVSRVGVLFNPEAGPYARNFMQTMAPVATASGIEVIAGPTLHTDGIEPFIASLAEGTKAGLIVTPDAFTSTNDSLIVSLAANHRLPSVYAYQYSAKRGGLLSYGHSTADVFRQGAEYVDKILRGANPADLPVQTPSRFELCINVKAAKALGIEIPPSLLARANEIIE
jgi:putative tryptophan/tyrosine transport system substrate-binding protein